MLTPWTPVIHFESLGPAVGISAHGLISFQIKLAPFLKHMAHLCEEGHLLYDYVQRTKTQAVPDELMGYILELSRTQQEECYQVAKPLTKLLTAYAKEDELIKHSLLKMDQPVYTEGHYSAAAPLNRGNRRYPIRQSRETQSEDFSHMDEDVEVLNDHEEYLYLAPTRLPESLMTTTPSHVRKPRATTFADFTDYEDGDLEIEETTPKVVRTITLADEVSTRRPGQIEIRRFKRFLGTLAAIGVGALGATAISGAFSGLFHSTVSESELRQAIQDMSAVMDAEQGEIKAMGEGYKTAMLNIKRAATIEHLLAAVDNQQIHNAINYRMIKDLEKGLTALLYKKLDPALVQPDELKELYEIIVTRMKRLDTQATEQQRPLVVLIGRFTLIRPGDLDYEGGPPDPGREDWLQNDHLQIQWIPAADGLGGAQAVRCAHRGEPLLGSRER